MAFSDALQNILTKGLDVAQSIKLAQIQVSDPTPYTSAANGKGSAVGQAAYGLSTTVSALAPVLVIGGLVIGAVLVFRLLGKK